MDFEHEYQQACSRGTDIHEHLPTLSRLTSECGKVIELGIASGQSARAFLRHDIEYIGYDIHLQPNVVDFFEDAKRNGRNIRYHVADSRTFVIEETDLLFIDTAHNYGVLKKELELHANQAKKYIVFHDTKTFGNDDETEDGPGLWPAIEEFLAQNEHWVIAEKYENNNGLTVLRRIN